MDTKTQLQEVTEHLSQLDPNNRDHLADIARLEQQKAVLTMQLEDAKTQEVATQERIQAQVEKVESITLPYDFNEVFGDPRANEMITELLKDMRRQDYVEHNGDITELMESHREELRAARDSNVQLKTQNDLLISENVRIANLFESEMHDHIETKRDLESEIDRIKRSLTSEIEDALNKRDAAVREKEGLETLLAEKQAHIDKLRDEAAIGAVAAVNVVNIDPSERLARLVEESKQAKVKSALDIALERSEPFRGKVITDSQAVAELHTPEVTPFQPVNQAGDTSNQLVTGPVSELLTINQEVDFRPTEVHSESTTVATGQPETSTEAITADYIEQRLAKFAEEHGLVKQGV